MSKAIKKADKSSYYNDLSALLLYKNASKLIQFKINLHFF
jgi:hypothetical protein